MSRAECKDQQPLFTGGFGCVVADPPWPFSDDLPGPGRGAAKHYSCGLSVDDIKRFQLPQLQHDCWLFLWRVGAMQREALEVAEAWGFRVDSEIVWVKTPRLRTPEQLAAEASACGWDDPAQAAAKLGIEQGRRVRIMMGRSVRNAHECCLICKRGKPYRADAGVPSVCFSELGEHSEKPDEFFANVERLVGPDTRKVELFARKHRPGWTCFGDEL